MSGRNWAIAALAIAGLVCSVQAQIVDEDFDSVTGSGGGLLLYGSGTGFMTSFDDGISGETAYGSASWPAHSSISVFGDSSSGVDSSGAAVLSVAVDSYNMIQEDFSLATGIGGGSFLDGNGQTNTSNTVWDWDSGVGYEEAAFFVAYSGAELVGSASVAGDPVSGIAYLDVDDVSLNSGGWYAGVSFRCDNFPGGTGILLNPDFELGGWTNIYQWDWWASIGSEYNSLLIATGAAHSGSQYVKMWGRAADRPTTGMSQTLVAKEGQTWELDCWTKHITGDSITGDNYMEMMIEYLNNSGEVILYDSSVILDSSSALDTWIDNTPLQLTAPAGTTEVRCTFQNVPGSGSGAGFVDDVSFSVISGPAPFDLAEFGVYADIRGIIDTVGETYGNYFLRLEDENGNKLAFQSDVIANGTWQTIGGPLDEAEEQNANSQPEEGAFDLTSDVIKAVIIFESGNWGTGGTIEIDNVLITNTRTNGADYSAELTWDALPLPASGILDPSELELKADIMGDVAGGEYQLKVEGLVAVASLDEDFSAITADNEVELFAPGESGGDADDYIPEIEGERAFGYVTSGTVTETGGGWARGLTTGGYGDDGGCTQLEVLDVYLNSGAIWYAGVVWENQRLASANLADTTISAMVKDEWNASYYQAAHQVILRIEDPEGDFLGFSLTGTGSWQAIGGPLSTADFTGTDGNGVFDIDVNIDYNVVIMFIGEGDPAPGNWGGILTIDDVYITPPATPVMTSVGEMVFEGTTDGTFQAVGGSLVDADSTWPSIGGQFYPDYGEEIFDFDAGIEGERAFVGNMYTSVGAAAAAGDPTGGVGGSGGAWFSWSDVAEAGGWYYYWAGISFHSLELDLSNPAAVEFLMDVKGEWDTEQGQTPGIITLRLEDPYGKRLGFHINADGSWQSIGGLLSNAVVDGDAGFSYTAPSYALTLIVHGPRTPAWGTGGKVWFDNMVININGSPVYSEDFETVVGPRPAAVEGLDALGVSVVMDGLATWGENATLTLDNLYLGEPQAELVDVVDVYSMATHAGTEEGIQIYPAQIVFGQPYNCEPRFGLTANKLEIGLSDVISDASGITVTATDTSSNVSTATVELDPAGDKLIATFSPLANAKIYTIDVSGGSVNAFSCEYVVLVGNLTNMGTPNKVDVFDKTLLIARLGKAYTEAGVGPAYDLARIGASDGMVDVFDKTVLISRLGNVAN